MRRNRATHTIWYCVLYTVCACRYSFIHTSYPKDAGPCSHPRPNGRGTPAGLEKGELDAILILDPQIVQLLETGKYRSIGNIGDIWREKTGQDPMLVSISMNEVWAKANPDIAKRFVAAYKEGTEYLKTHTDVWPDLAKKLDIKSEAGVKLLRERTVPNLVTKWDKKIIDDQYRYLTDILKVFGDAEGMPKQIPDGTFDLSYAP